MEVISNLEAFEINLALYLCKIIHILISKLLNIKYIISVFI